MYGSFFFLNKEKIYKEKKKYLKMGLEEDGLR